MTSNTAFNPVKKTPEVNIFYQERFLSPLVLFSFDCFALLFIIKIASDLQPVCCLVARLSYTVACQKNWPPARACDYCLDVWDENCEK